MPSILWVRSNPNEEETRALEATTGLRVVAESGSLPKLSRHKSQLQVVLVELPLGVEVIEEILAEASCGGQAPLSVVIYDKDSEFDESLIPFATPFRHLVGVHTIGELGANIALVIDQAAQRRLDTGLAREPWRELLIGESRPLRELHSMIRLVAPRQATVLITGETGTGKELVARAIHMASKRATGRMVAVNCAAIPENLVEAELFGHAKGSFTGAVNDRVGRFELAHHGTIFLDEIGEIPIEVQPKLLRVLQERELQRVGGSGTIQIDTRVIAATNIDLEAAVAEKKFREDLLYRLNVVPIRLPALRERVSDIPLLAEHLVEKICRREELELKQLSPEALRRLTNYAWPGNVRQLEHVIEMAITLAGDRERLYGGDIRLPETMPLAAVPHASTVSMNYDHVIARLEKMVLREALRSCGGNKAKAAGMLGLKRTTLLYKVKALEAIAV
jgi:transcriptional regulator with GAF, ATPase, and Fis domain